MTLNDNVNDTGSIVAVAVSGRVVDSSGAERELRRWPVRLGHVNWTVGIIREQRFLPGDHHCCDVVSRAPSKRRR